MSDTRPFSYRTRLDGTTKIDNVRGAVRIVRAKIEGTTIVAHGDGTATITVPGSGVRGGLVVWADDAGEHSTACVVPSREESDAQDLEFGAGDELKSAAVERLRSGVSR